MQGFVLSGVVLIREGELFTSVSPRDGAVLNAGEMVSIRSSIKPCNASKRSV